MFAKRATRLAVGLLLPLTLTANACASSGEEDEALIEVDSGQVGQAEGAVATTTTAAGDTAEAEGAAGSEEAGETSPADSGEATGGTDGSDAVNAKALAATTIADFAPAEDPVNGADEADAVFDQPNEGEIEETFGADRWSFEGTDGQMIALEVLDIGNDCTQDLQLNIESPSGARHNWTWAGNGGCYAHGPLLLDETGTWVLEFAGGDGSIISDDTGPYRFVITTLTEFDVAPATLDQEHQGEISELFGVDHWTFEGSAGDQLSIEVLEIGDDCYQDLQLSLIDPFEERTELEWVGNGGCEVHGPYTLERDGTYAIEFSGGDAAVIDSPTGSYTFIPKLIG